MAHERQSATGPTYSLLLDLEHLESMREEMEELGVTTATALADLGSPTATTLLQDLREQGLESVADLNARIAQLHAQLDQAGETT
jgi:hypothetical protein